MIVGVEVLPLPPRHVEGGRGEPGPDVPPSRFSVVNEDQGRFGPVAAPFPDGRVRLPRLRPRRKSGVSRDASRGVSIRKSFLTTTACCCSVGIIFTAVVVVVIAVFLIGRRGTGFWIVRDDNVVVVIAGAGAGAGAVVLIIFGCRWLLLLLLLLNNGNYSGRSHELFVLLSLAAGVFPR